MNHASTQGNYRFAIPAVTEFCNDFVAAVGRYQNSVNRNGPSTMTNALFP